MFLLDPYLSSTSLSPTSLSSTQQTLQQKQQQRLANNKHFKKDNKFFADDFLRKTHSPPTSFPYNTHPHHHNHNNQSRYFPIPGCLPQSALSSMARYQSGYSSSSFQEGRPRSPYNTQQNNKKRHYEDNTTPPPSLDSDGHTSPVDDVISSNLTSPTTLELKLTEESLPSSDSPPYMKRFKKEEENEDDKVSSS